MEKEEIKEIQIEEPKQEENTPVDLASKQTGFVITTPIAIIIAGFLIMAGVLLTNGGGDDKVAKAKTLSEQVGVNKEKFTQCMTDTNLEELRAKTNTSAESAMKGIPAGERGTPFAVIIGKNGVKSEIRGAYPKADVQKLIDEVITNKVAVAYKGEVPEYQEGDHIIGNPEAPIMIIEYSDLECPYCKRFGETMKEVVSESNGNVAWVYRHWIVHQGALSKAGASECVAKLKGEDAFWKYIDLVFGLMKTEEAAPTVEL